MFTITAQKFTIFRLRLIRKVRLQFPLYTPMKVKANVRYRHIEQDATVTQLDENTLHVVFDEPVRAPAPGQALVLYDGERVIGGGTIV